MRQNVKLTAGMVKYLGNEELVQFQVMKTVMISRGSDYIVVEITLRRMISYHIVSTFSPTLFLLLIGILTLFLDESHFEATIMLAITAMLVMYTLYESASSGLPKTAYLKMVDIWLIFGLVVPFIVFLVEMIAEIMRNLTSEKECEEQTEESKIETISLDQDPAVETKLEKSPQIQDSAWMESEKMVAWKDIRSKLFRALFEPSMLEKYGKATTTKKPKSKLKVVAQRVIPTSCFFFILGYIICALTYYNS